LYVRVVIFWISVRSAGYYVSPALLCVGGGPGPPVGGRGEDEIRKTELCEKLARGKFQLLCVLLFWCLEQ
jgi:hypothetical protein